MTSLEHTGRRGLLDETTMTLHKQGVGVGEFRSSCRQLTHVGAEQLQLVDIPPVAKRYNTSKCQHCFEAGGGH